MDSVTICNLALGMIGIPEITSFDEDSNSARQCKRFYPVMRDRVLRDHAWSFAVAAFDLAATTDTPPDPAFDIVCALPGDCVRVLQLADGNPFRRFGKRIAVRALPARVLYVRRVEDPDLFDSAFVEALQYLIAAELAMANTRDAQLAQFYRQEYERRLAVARSIDSQENRAAFQPPPPRSHWIEARGGTGCAPRRQSGGINWVEGTEGKQV